MSNFAGNFTYMRLLSFEPECFTVIVSLVCRADNAQQEIILVTVSQAKTQEGIKRAAKG